MTKESVFIIFFNKFNPSSVVAGIFRKKTVADTLAPCVAWPSTAVELNMKYWRVPVLHQELLQQPGPSQSWKMIESANTFF